MASIRRKPLKVVTDSEDDQSDSRQRRDLHITKRVSTITEEKEDKKKKVYQGFSHTLPIHTLTKASVLSKEAPPENYSGFLRLGSTCVYTLYANSKDLTILLLFSVSFGCQ